MKGEESSGKLLPHHFQPRRRQKHPSHPHPQYRSNTKRLQFERGASRNKPFRATLNAQSAPDFRKKSPLSSKAGRLYSTGSISFRNLVAEAPEADSDSRREEEATLPSEYLQMQEVDTGEGQHGPKPSRLPGVSDDVCAGWAVGPGDATPPVRVKQPTSSVPASAPALRQRRSVPLLRNGTKLPHNIDSIPRSAPIVEGSNGHEIKHHHRTAITDENIAQGPQGQNSGNNNSSSIPSGSSTPAKNCKKLVRSGLRRIAYDSAKPLARPERARLSSDPVRWRDPSTTLVGGRAKMKPGMMRVLLPGEGARDYASLLKGSEALRVRELESRAATAEAEVMTMKGVLLLRGGGWGGFA